MPFTFDVLYKLPKLVAIKFSPLSFILSGDFQTPLSLLRSFSLNPSLWIPPVPRKFLLLCLFLTCAIYCKLLKAKLLFKINRSRCCFTEVSNVARVFLKVYCILKLNPISWSRSWLNQSTLCFGYTLKFSDLDLHATSGLVTTTNF